MNTRTYTMEELQRMPTAQAQALIQRACRIEGTAVVRRADGSVKYDNPELAGTYNEAAINEHK